MHPSPLGAYVEIEASHCLRFEREDYGEIIHLDKRNAKDECSKERRCVGVESIDDGWDSYFTFCLDSIYRTIGWAEYENLTNEFFKKEENYGKCKSHCQT